MAMWQQRVDVAGVRSRSFARLACRCGLSVRHEVSEGPHCFWDTIYIRITRKSECDSERRAITVRRKAGFTQNMDSQKFILSFVKIVERYPVLYDTKVPHRTPHLCSMTWEQVAEAVRNELHEDCAVEELKTKWKGIRSSFSRFLRKIENSRDREGTKQYYLYDSLKFLHPHTKTKQRPYSEKENNDDQSSDIDEWDSEMTVQMWNDDDVNHTSSKASELLAMSTENRVHPEVKIEPADEEEIVDTTNVNNDENPLTLDKDRELKRKSTNTCGVTTPKAQKTEENADLQFFKSILPDIDHFTKQEKRKFKMGVLKLIDDIEHSRRDVRSNSKALDKLASRHSNF